MGALAQAVAKRWDSRLHPRGPDGRFVRVFAYGSNLDAATMQLRAPGSRPVQRAELPDHRLTFPGGLPNVESAEGESVPGAVYDVPEYSVGLLDFAEGGYDRRTMELAGGVGPVRVYQMTDTEGWRESRSGPLYEATKRGRKQWNLAELD